ncbi:MAG: coproporphyrinogen-III oxidase family protein [Kiritimatiellia bacterium]
MGFNQTFINKFKNVTGLYVHVPFCDGKCFYCAFYSVPYRGGWAAKYLRALETELKQYPPLEVETVYIGGGTPSALDPDELKNLFALIKNHIRADLVKEWTVECNPGSLTPGKLAILAQNGVNRISLGAQSFDDDALKWLGRRHSAADIFDAVEMIKAAGFDNFGLDLIACIPGFKQDVWRKTLSAAIALEPMHISVYALTREEGSRLARETGEKQNSTLPDKNCSRPRRGRSGVIPLRPNRLAQGFAGAKRRDYAGQAAPGYNPASHNQIELLSEDEEIEALDLAENILTAEGYMHYEISNYALPGFECRHNLDCWRGGEYIGLGPAASSHAGLMRWTSLPDLVKYTEALERDLNPPREVDPLDPELKQLEMIVFGLRLAEGISKATGRIREEKLRELCREGLVADTGDGWRLSRRGFYLADYVGRELLAGRNAE